MLINANAIRIPLQDKSVHMCCCSPPYFGLRDYKVDGQLGLETTPAEYVANMVAAFSEVWRVLRDDGTCWVVLGDTFSANRSYQVTDSKHKNVGNHKAMRAGSGRADGIVTEDSPRNRDSCTNADVAPKNLLGIPWRVAFALQDFGWYLRSDIIWAKPNPMPESCQDRPTRSHEYVFLLAKKPRYYYDWFAVAEQVAESTLTRVSLANGRNGDADIQSRPAEAYKRCQTARVSVDTYKDGRDHLVCAPKYHRRNARSVWTIATQPTPFAHFATFPEELVRRCILAGTSEKGVCAKCGAQWVRETEREGGKSYSTGKSSAKNTDNLRTAFSGYDDGSSAPSFSTSGWRQSCSCPTTEVVPATVLDPFAGSCTTVKVANDLLRRGIGLDLNMTYLREIGTHRAMTRLFT